MGLYFGSVLVDLLALLTTVAAVSYVFFQWTYQYWKRRNVPYLKPTIPWGNLENPLRRTMSIAENVTQIYKQAKAKGWKYFGIYIVAEINLVVTDLDIIKQIMTKDFQSFVDRGFYYNEKDDPLSAHLFSIGGAKWKNLRSKLSPTFTSGKLKSMFSTLVDCGLVLEKYIEGSIKTDEAIDIKDVLAKFTIDIIGSCAFGLECNSFKEADSPFRTYGRKIVEVGPVDAFKVTMAGTFPNASKALGLCILPKDSSSFFRKVVHDTINYRRDSGLKRNDFLQLLIEIMQSQEAVEHGLKDNSRTLTMDEAAAQCFIFFLAGFETSSTTMTFALYNLARHQDLQDKVRAEIKTVLAKHDNQITYDSLSELKYMKQVIDETLRLYSPLPFVTRVSAEDYKLPGEDLVLEKGTKVIIPIQAIHMDDDIYKNPSEFDPDRFSEENKAVRHPYAHIPFGEGPRICIGERFGIMQTKVGLTSLLRNFRVTLNKRTQLPLKIAKSPFVPCAEGGVWVNFERL